MKRKSLRIPLWFVGDDQESALDGLVWDDGADAHRWATENGTGQKVYSAWAYVDPASIEEDME